MFPTCYITRGTIFPLISPPEVVSIQTTHVRSHVLSERECRHRASRLVAEGAQALAAANGGEPAFVGEAWNGCLMDMVRLAKAHAYLVLQHTYAAHVRDLQDKVPPASSLLPGDCTHILVWQVISANKGLPAAAAHC